MFKSWTMKSRVNLVAILLTLSCAARVLEGLKSDEKHSSHKEYYPVGKKIVKEVHNKAAPQSAALLRIEDKTKILKSKNTGFGLSKDYFHGPGNRIVISISRDATLNITLIFVRNIQLLCLFNIIANCYLFLLLRIIYIPLFDDYR